MDFKVLVTGSTGFLGQAVCAQLEADGFEVRGALRFAVGGQSSEDRGQIELPSGINHQRSLPEFTVVGDINGLTDWAEALESVDVVVHLAARVHIMDDTAQDPLAAFREVNVEGTRRLAEAAVNAGVKRFVFVSSIKVNGEQTAARSALECGGSGTALAFSERDKPAPEDPYGQSKYEAEQVLREIEAATGMEVVILRPPLLYGPGVKANFLKLIRIVDKGIPLPLGGIDNQRSLLGLTNFADLIVTCITDARAAGQTFTVCDGEDVSSAELVRRIAKALGRKPRLLPVPEGLMRLAGTCTGKTAQVQRLCSSLRIDSSHVCQTLDWNPPCTMEEELSRTAKFFRGQKSEN